MLYHRIQRNPLSILSCITFCLVLLYLSLKASAAPIPPSLTRQPLHTYNNTHFPYAVQGPAPPPIHRAGAVLDQCTQVNSYAISFDDGPGQLSDELLDYLEDQHLKATFFMNGDNWSCIYGSDTQRLLRRAYNDQHQIAAHPWSHRDLASSSEAEIREEMARIEQAFRDILGVVPRYMRPPFGEHGERVRKILEDMGYVLILWDVDHHHHKETLGTKERNVRKEGSLSLLPTFGSTSDEFPMSGYHHSHHRSSLDENNLQQQADAIAFRSKWAEAVRGVPSSPLDRDAMSLSGAYQEVTSAWAVEYVQSLGYDVMPVAQCLGEADPRLWYKEIGPPVGLETISQNCRS
ncbi:peptidoglycan-N-acetylglucosamine deacetylase [Entomortierella parvispora]|uniref:Peptidoglycan-N-acetylglucosamine deacetylase n=1 Tax=Entomortierella parvispora TaxID=205924 RepID=A0A9P3M0I5_9FUNG|nr:peptidoglycan-N-acetylglucosamine deacetylase [Entomortierella parvispora]